MKFATIFPYIDLQLCAEGAGGEGVSDAGGAKGVTGADAMSQQGVKINPLEDVQYGIQMDGVQTTDAQNDSAEGASKDLNAEFEKLIKGEFKEQYNQRVQDTVQKRLKGTQEMQARMEAVNPILETLASKYGVKADDIAALSKAIEEDNSFYEEEAMENGISVEQLKQIRKIERENADLKRQMQEQSNRENANKLYAAWMEQADKVKSIYPAFNLETEMQNPQFVNLLRSNVDVRTAFEVLHKDEIIPAAMQYTAKTVEQNLANKFRANASRPSENGTRSQSSVTTKSDVTQLSNDDISEVIRRINRGDRISFG